MEGQELERVSRVGRFWINWLSRIFSQYWAQQAKAKAWWRRGFKEPEQKNKTWSSLCHQVLTDWRLTREAQHMVTKDAGMAFGYCEFS